jgi:glyoxylase-like metal-dependent hydrolase (beta-lactamase superfamily II)
MKITSNIFQVGGSEESYSSDASIYLITDKEEAALVDAGTGVGHQQVLKNIDGLGISLSQIKYLFLTHCHFDHSGGANAIRRATGCKIVAHELDSCYIEDGDNEVTGASWYGSFLEKTIVDIKVKDKSEKFKIGGLEIYFHHTPGHSPGSSVLTVMSDNNLVLFGQDVHGPINDLLLSNRNDYNNSLEFMMSIDADILCEGHFGVFFKKEVVRDFIGSFL